MPSKKKDFYAKDIKDAITKACDGFAVAGQEQLDIEVVEAGSSGIFGLIRKKAHIRASLREAAEEETAVPETTDDVVPLQDASAADTPAGGSGDSDAKEIDARPTVQAADDAGRRHKEEEATEPAVSSQSLERIRNELLQIVELMGFPADLELDCRGLSVFCTLRGEFEEDLTGPDGKVLDSLQYLMRKIVARKTPEQIRFFLDVGDFRQRRLEELRARAMALAALVNKDGKTLSLQGLNPAERREVHLALEEVDGVRSRSIGDGHYKKILIYKPGKGRRPRKKRSQGTTNQNAEGQKPSRSADES
ncbi:MAG: RNA-binding protein [Deltaproteobacteria bacterium]|nr:MAG: RNA-binding protein [Deltaproteobacteria bacterium]PIE73001.1 MAG: RNA-binding protein [Deltaproteobacteria bacterium]